MTPTYSMSDLVQLTGLEARTIRYYIAQGLIPKPQTRGRNARYGEAHLDRLKVIVLLRSTQKLEEIQAWLHTADPEALQEVLARWEAPPPKISAQDYLATVADDFGPPSPSRQQDPEVSSSSLVRPSFPSTEEEPELLKLQLRLPSMAPLRTSDGSPHRSRSRRSPSLDQYSESSLPSSELTSPRAEPPEGASSPLEELIRKLAPHESTPLEPQTVQAKTWKVLTILPGVELHLKDPDALTLTRMERVAELIRNTLTGASDD